MENNQDGLKLFLSPIECRGYTPAKHRWHIRSLLKTDALESLPADGYAYDDFQAITSAES